MPILDSEILWRPALLVSDATPAQNGGRMAASQLISGVKNNLFPDVSQSERQAGSVRWRKAFIHLASAQDTALLNARVFLDTMTPAGDFVTLTPGTATDTEDQIAGRAYGIAALAVAVAAGAGQLVLIGEHPAEYETLLPFRIGDLIRVADRPTVGAGHEEWCTLTQVAYADGRITVDLDRALANPYAVANTLVSSVIARDAVAAKLSNITVTSAAGQLDTATASRVVVHNKGAIEEDWSLMFTSATEFSVSGLGLGVLSIAGTVNADYAPVNPLTGTPYFTITAAAWSGAFQAQDAVTFRTSPAAIALWYRRRVPPGTASLGNNVASVALQGESS